MNWKSSSSVSEVSVSGITSFRVSNPGGGKPPACVSRFFLWMRKRTPSLDWNVTSPSSAQTVQNPQMNITNEKLCHSQVAETCVASDINESGDSEIK
jgi:hypothetical protein